jgi:Tol biopolymer transport system component
MSELKILDIVRASTLADGSEARPYSRHGGNSPIGVGSPSLSDDGTKVAFVSDFLNLVPDDSNGQSDIFVKDLTTGAITRANTTADGAQSERGNGLDLPEKVAGGSSLSGDGTKVAFWSAAPDLVPGDTNDMNGIVPGIDIFVKDLINGAITRASTTTDGAQASGTSALPDLSLSADGTKVAFASDAPDLVLDDTNGETDIFVKDLTTGAIMRANTAADGTQGNGFYNLSPELSADGTKIAFVSDATNLVPGDTNNTWDIFIVSVIC